MLTDNKMTCKKLKELATLQLIKVVLKYRWEFSHETGERGYVHAFSYNGGQRTYVKPVQLFVGEAIRQAIIFVHRNKSRGFDYLLDTVSGRIYIHHVSNDNKSLGYLGFIDLRCFVSKLNEIEGHYGVLPKIDEFFYADDFYTNRHRNIVEWITLKQFKSKKYIPTSLDMEQYNFERINHLFDYMLTSEYYNGLRDFEQDRIQYQYSIENKRQLDLMEFIKPN